MERKLNRLLQNQQFMKDHYSVTKNILDIKSDYSCQFKRICKKSKKSKHIIWLKKDEKIQLKDKLLWVNEPEKGAMQSLVNCLISLESSQNEKSIERILLYLSDWTVIPSKLKNLIYHVLSTNINIHEITLSFHIDNSINDQDCLQIFNSLKNLKKLTKLNLTFYSNIKITDNGIFYLSELSKYTPNLKSFEFQLSRNNNLTDVSLAYLSNAFKNWPNLETFLFYFTDNTQVTNQGLMNFYEQLGKLTKLQNLSFYNGKNTVMDNTAFIALSHAITQMPKLAMIYLSFENSTRIQESALKEFLTKISSNPNLESISLDLYKVSSNQNQNTLGAICSPISKIPYFSILFGNTNYSNIHSK